MVGPIGGGGGAPQLNPNKNIEEKVIAWTKFAEQKQNARKAAQVKGRAVTMNNSEAISIASKLTIAKPEQNKQTDLTNKLTFEEAGKSKPTHIKFAAPVSNNKYLEEPEQPRQEELYWFDEHNEKIGNNNDDSTTSVTPVVKNLECNSELSTSSSLVVNATDECNEEVCSVEQIREELNNLMYWFEENKVGAQIVQRVLQKALDNCVNNSKAVYIGANKCQLDNSDNSSNTKLTIDEINELRTEELKSSYKALQDKIEVMSDNRFKTTGLSVEIAYAKEAYVDLCAEHLMSSERFVENMKQEEFRKNLKDAIDTIEDIWKSRPDFMVWRNLEKLAPELSKGSPGSKDQLSKVTERMKALSAYVNHFDSIIKAFTSEPDFV